MASTQELNPPERHPDVETLTVTTYDEQGWHHTDRNVPSPTWADVEAAVRELDHFRRPHLFLRLAADPELTWFSVLGGPEGYSMTGSLDGKTQHIFVDPTHSQDEVAVWRSDQGFRPPAWNVCFDLDAVLRATRHFFQFAEFDPRVEWDRS